MEILTKEQLWRCFLRKEPTREQRKRRFMWEGCIYYTVLFRRYPVRCLAEIGALIVIFACMFGLLWIPEIAAWIQGVMR